VNQGLCNLAGYITNTILRDATQTIYDDWVASVDIATVILDVVAIVVGIVVGPWVGLIAYAAETVFAHVALFSTDWDDVLNDDTYWGLLSCEIYCILLDHGELNQAAYDAIIYLVTYYPSQSTEVSEALGGWLTNLTLASVTANANTGIRAAYDCSNCDCDQGTDPYTVIRLDGCGAGGTQGDGSYNAGNDWYELTAIPFQTEGILTAGFLSNLNFPDVTNIKANVTLAPATRNVGISSVALMVNGAQVYYHEFDNYPSGSTFGHEIDWSPPIPIYCQGVLVVLTVWGKSTNNSFGRVIHLEISGTGNPPIAEC